MRPEHVAPTSRPPPSTREEAGRRSSESLGGQTSRASRESSVESTPEGRADADGVADADGMRIVHADGMAALELDARNFYRAPALARERTTDASATLRVSAARCATATNPCPAPRRRSFPGRPQNRRSPTAQGPRLLWTRQEYYQPVARLLWTRPAADGEDSLELDDRPRPAADEEDSLELDDRTRPAADEEDSLDLDDRTWFDTGRGLLTDDEVSRRTATPAQTEVSRRGLQLHSRGVQEDCTIANDIRDNVQLLHSRPNK